MSPNSAIGRPNCLRSCACFVAAVVEDRHRDLEALALLAEQVLGGDAHVGEADRGGRGRADAHLVLVRPMANAFPGRLDDERGNLAARPVGAGEHGIQVGDAAVGDPDLLAVQDPAAVGLPACGRPQRRGVRPGTGFGQAEGGNHLAARQLREVAGALRRVAEQQDALHADGAVRADGQRHRGVVAAGLAQDPRIGRVRQAESAMLLGDDEPEQAQLPQLLDELGRLSGLLVPALEVLRMIAQEGVDRVDHRLENLAVTVTHARVGKHVGMQDLPAKQGLGCTLVG
jgi:hypothetical protein